MFDTSRTTGSWKDAARASPPQPRELSLGEARALYGAAWETFDRQERRAIVRGELAKPIPLRVVGRLRRRTNDEGIVHTPHRTQQRR